MPQVFILLGATFGATLGGGLVASVGLSVALKQAVFTTGLAALGLLWRRQQTRPRSEHEVRSTIEPARWILGTARTSGLLVFYRESENTTKYGPLEVDVILALSEGACESIEKVYINGASVGISGRTPIVGGEQIILSSTWNDHIKVYAYLSADGTGGSSLRTRHPTLWTTNHKLGGISYVHIRMIQNQYDINNPQSKFWQRYPNIEFLVKGVKVTFPGQSIPVWTDNAAALRYWYMTEILGVSPERIDEDHFRYAYSVCDQEVSFIVPSNYSAYANSSSGSSHTNVDKRYSINGIVTTEDDSSEILEEMNFAWQGTVVEQDATLYFRPGIDRIPRYTIDSSVIIAPGTINTSPSVQDRVNAISMSLIQSSVSDYKPQDIKSLQDEETIQNRDHCLCLWQNIGVRRFVVNPISAGRLMWISLYRSRGLRSCTYTVSPGPNLEFLNVIPGDIANVNDPYLGVNMNMVVITAVTNDDWSVTLELVEKTPNEYVSRLHLPGPPAAPLVSDPNTVPDLPDLPPHFS